MANISVVCMLLNKDYIHSLTHSLTDAIDNYESARNLPDNVCDHNITAYKTLCTGGIFATYPRQFLSLASGFIDQVGVSYFAYVHMCVQEPTKLMESDFYRYIFTLVYWLDLWIIYSIT